MCGRYVFSPGGAGKFQQRFDLSNRVEVEPKYNVAPGQVMPVIKRESPKKAVMMKWGLVPFWAKDPRIGYKMINARIESIAYKPSFRKAFRTQRCLVPANGFYEWKRTDGKQPYYIHSKDKELIAFAGLYESWKDAEGKQLKTYTIITTQADSLLAPIHNRMPVIIKKENEDKWLDKEVQDPQLLMPLIKPASASNLECYPVSKLVNKASEEGKVLIKRQKSS